MASDTRILPFGEAAIAEAAALIRAGRPVATPTETVYGLAADATDADAVAGIYAAKGRPSFNPLIVHVPDVEAAARLADVDAVAARLAARFWPGPLTMVLPAREGSPIARIATAGLMTIALRAPAHRAMRALLAAADRPLAAPSANASGTISPTRAGHVARSLGGRIPLVIDDGATGVGIESTIVAVAPDRLRLLRPGPILPEALAEAAGLPIEGATPGLIEAPGQMTSHYAPAKPLRLNVEGDPGDAYLIGFGPEESDYALSQTGDPVEAAARLFDALHAADLSDRASIAIRSIPDAGLGAAINDRLRRAAA